MTRSLQKSLQPILELAAVLGAGDQGTQVQRMHAFVFERLGHIALRDPLGKAFAMAVLPTPASTNQDRVVLGPTREYLDDAADLLLATD